VVLPLFAFSAVGIRLSIDLSHPGASRVFLGVVVGLVVGKPLGISLASWLAVRARLAIAPDAVRVVQFVGAAALCGIGGLGSLILVAGSRGPARSLDRPR
jgi:NhaA family Na+:H+ antiporter